MKRIFPAVKLRLQTPPIDKREIGERNSRERNCVPLQFPGNAEYILLPQPPPPPTLPPLGPLTNERRHAVTRVYSTTTLVVTIFV